MSHKLATILLGFFVLAAAFGPRLVLANNEPIHGSCHETPKEMPTACAVHCLSVAINENEVDSVLDSVIDFSAPVMNKNDLVFFDVKNKTDFFLELTVFREIYPILTTIKRE